MASTPLQLLAQADLLLFVADGFREPNDALRDGFSETASALPALIERAGAGRAVEASFEEARAALDALDVARWREEFTYLFEGGVECPINEAGFVRRDKGAILGDIAGFYRAFGFRLTDDCNERVDHLVCELEFTAMLLVLWAQAETGGERAHAEISRDALDAFTYAHLGEWLPAFCERLEEVTALPYYCHLARLLAVAWAHVCQQNALAVPAEPNLSDPGEDEGTPYECGLADAGIA